MWKKARWITTLGLAVGLLALLATSAAAGPGDGEDRPYDLLVEVAHPRGAILTSQAGAVENFAHGDGRTVTVVQGQVVRFKSGFGYEGVWYDGAEGTLTTTLEVFRREDDGSLTPLGHDGDEMTATGPRIESGEATVDVPFDDVGTFEIVSQIVSTARPAGQVTAELIQDSDEVTTTVVVMDPKELGSISGTVIDEATGAPIVGLRVGAMQPTSRYHRFAATDEEGGYVISNLPAGEYLVAAIGRGTPYQTEYYDNVSHPRHATPITVTEGSETTGIDFALLPKPRTEAGEQGQAMPDAAGIVDVAEDGFLSLWPADVVDAEPEDPEPPGEPGRYDVLHEVAHPRAAVTAGLGAAENFAHGHGASITIAMGQTVRFKSGFGYEGVWFEGGAGRVLFGIEVAVQERGEWVDKGRDFDTYGHREPAIEHGSAYVDVTFRRPGTYPVRSHLVTEAQPGDGTPARDTDVVTTTVHVVDPHTLGAISGTVTDEAGSPLADVMVVVHGGPDGRRMEARARTGADGTYTVRRLLPGRYLAAARPRPDSGYVGEFYEDAATKEEATPVAVLAGETTTGIDFALAAQ